MAIIRRDFLPADLEPVLKENGIDGCVAVQASQSEEETLFLVNMAQSYEIVKGVVGWVDLQSATLSERLKFFSQYPEIKGYRHVAQGEPDDFLARPAVVEGIRQLADFGLTYDILIYPSQHQKLRTLSGDIPSSSIKLHGEASDGSYPLKEFPDFRLGKIVMNVGHSESGRAAIASVTLSAIAAVVS